MKYKKISLIILLLLVSISVVGCDSSNVNNQKNVSSSQDLSELNKIEQSEKKSVKPIIDIPNSILKQDFAGVIEIMGVPVKEEFNIGTDEEVLNYSTPEFKLEIKFFMNTPMTIDVTPLKEYKYTGNSSNDVEELLSDIGFHDVLEEIIVPGQNVFLYNATYGKLIRKYEIRVNCKDWRAVSEGKGSKVSRVYIKLADTK